ncbi:glutathione peroxidase [Carboxylicivirga taeanensis]|uniref:glutathione peroxidase n=1 Tax=Carboxylicivirga taeanensis TaxID=1416875 RepID=UPI003F6DB0D2
MKSFYDFSIPSASGKTIYMNQFKGQLVLIINTATRCGFASQFKGLEELHRKYKDKGLVVLGVPCNQFLNQEPESNDTIEQICQLNFGVTFQLTSKVDVNGPNAHPIFFHSKNEFGGFLGKSIKWNFTKFLVLKDGTPYKRYAPFVKPSVIEKDLLQLL